MPEDDEELTKSESFLLTKITKLEQEIAAIYARLYHDWADDAMTMCEVLTTQEQRDVALEELRKEDTEKP